MHPDFCCAVFEVARLVAVISLTSTSERADYYFPEEVAINEYTNSYIRYNFAI